MKNVNEKRFVAFRIVRIMLCILVMGLYFNSQFSLANEFDIDDLVLAIGDDLNGEGVSFSFDGIAPYEIVLSSEYEGTDIEWKYSLDRGLNWTTGEGLRKKLSDEEISRIDAEADIIVKITDLINLEEREFIIDITKATLPNNLYANDLENRLYGTLSNLEWSFDGYNWILFDEKVPDLTGDADIQVRVARNKTTLESEVATFKFTKNTWNKNRKYVSLSRIFIQGFSSQEENFKAINSLDGCGLTYWKTSQIDTNRYMIFKLENPIYLSALEYLPVNVLSNLKHVKLSVSMDGENWTQVAEVDNLVNDMNIKSLELSESILAKYIKFEGLEVYGEEAPMAIAMFNIFEDNTKRVAPTAKISYDIVELTNKNVTARLVEVSPNTTVTSEGGSEHVFSENGSFKFTFVNELGMTGEVTAVVDWIDKVMPSAEIRYTTNSNGSVKATIINETEPIEIVNNGGNRSYTFFKNGTFDFILRDLAGNENRVVATVNSITNKRPARPSSSSNNSSANGSSTSGSTSIDKNEDNREPVDEKPEDNASNTTDDVNKTDVKVSNSYSINNASIEVLGEPLNTPLALKMDTKDLSKTLKAKVGKGSVFFEIYFVDEKGERVNIDRNYKMILKLDSGKIFRGIYKVEDNDKTVKLEYTTRGANEIELDIDALSNFVISYDEKTSIERKASTMDYIVALILAVLLALAAIIVYKRTR